MKTAAVVVTYNRLDMLQQCVRALLAQTVSCDILLVDNASSDGTESWAADCIAKHRCIHYRNTGANLGGAGGFNFGMRWAVEAGYDYVWVMDDDCIPDPAALEKLLEADGQLNGQYGWLSSQCLWTDGSLCPMNLQRRNPYQDIAGFDNSLVSAQMASFVSLFLRTDTVRKFGLPIREFFIWTDDWEFTRRISRSVPCYAVRDSRVVHAMKQNRVVSIAGDSIDRLPRYRFAYRNDVYLYRREGLPGWLWLLAKDCWHSIQVLKTRQDCGRQLAVIWNGFWEGIQFHPSIERSFGP